MICLVAVLALGLAPGQDAGKAPANLAWKLNKDDKFYVETVTKIDQTITLPGGQKQKQNQDQTTFHRYRVLENADGKIVLEQTILRTLIAGNIASEDAEKRLKNVVLTYTLDRKFKVTKMTGYDKFLDAASGGDKAAKKALAAMFSEDVLKIGVEDLFGMAPEKPVSAGTTWNRDAKLSMGPIGDFAMAAKYKYVGPAEGGEKVTLTAEMTYSAPKGDAEGLPFKITKGELKAEKFEGTIIFDPKVGRLKSSEATMKMAGKLTFSINGMEIPVEIIQDMKITSKVLEKNPVVD